MNLLWIKKRLRNRGFGTEFVTLWEDEMRASGYDTVMTSTLSSEPAQHLSRKLGYKDCGSLLMPDEPLEILFAKRFA